VPDNVAALVRAAGRRSPGRTALIYGPDRLSWGDLDARVDAVAAALVGQGLRPGDRVAVHLGNTPDFAAVYFGALRAGLVAVPLNTSYAPAELSRMLTDAGARVLVSGDPAALTAAARVAGLEHRIFAGAEPPAGVQPLDSLLSADGLPADSLPADSLPADSLPAERMAPEEVGGGEDLAVVLYTSGSRGVPKGAMLSHRALLANLEQLSRLEPPVLGPDDVVLLVVPLFHVYGLNAGLGLLAYHGATGVLATRFDPVRSLELIRRHQVTTVAGAPAMYVAWSMVPDLADAFATVRLATSGSAPLPASTSAALAERTGVAVFEGYGLTETAPVLTSTLVGGVPKPDSIGRPIPGVELKLIDEDGDGVEEDDAGEIAVRGANLFSGYWPDGDGGPDADGWFATGDVAFADGDGDLHLIGRRKELILVSGFNVYPREVEAVLRGHPGIADAAVVAVGAPTTGEAVKAVVVSAPGARLTAEAVIAHCQDSLARFKCPSVVEFVGELPYSATGKVRRDQLRPGGSP